MRGTDSLWQDQTRKRRKPKPLPKLEPWAGPGDERTPVVLVTGPLGGGKSRAVARLCAAREVEG